MVGSAWSATLEAESLATNRRTRRVAERCRTKQKLALQVDLPDSIKIGACEPAISMSKAYTAKRHSIWSFDQIIASKGVAKSVRGT